jgi:ribonuclease inhibitor
MTPYQKGRQYPQIMKNIEINCEKLRSRKVLHDYLERTLSLPAYYGRNLDALHDHLAMCNANEAIHFIIVNREKQSSRTVELYSALLDMLTKLSEVNPNISFEEL